MSGESPAVACARRFVAGLLGAGVRDVVLCPGSRSAPLAYALWETEQCGNALRLHVRADERAAGFLALGCGRGDPSRPAVVVTTSGTAVANLLPAVWEARHAGVPLLLVTADRPAQLRGTWANQTSAYQPTAFGAAALRTALVPAPTSADDPAAWAALAAAVVADSLTGRGGPVHVDLEFAEPLVPSGSAVDPGSAYPQVGDPPARTAATEPTHVLPRGPRTVVVAGDGAGRRARELAEAGGWPLLAEPSSGSLGGAYAIPAYRLVLAAGPAEPVERVVVVGHPTLSRPVSRLLADPAVELVRWAHHADDPGPGPTRTETMLVGCLHPGAGAADDPWLARWKRAGAAAHEVVAEAADGAGTPGGLEVARSVVRATRPGEALVVAASNPIRDLDLVAAGLPDDVTVTANRGLAGIDGTIGTAYGVAVTTGRPTRLLIGDLAFLHDAGALAVPAAERDRGVRLQVVVVDDDGGGIFATLEHGQRPASFERVFGTPHGVDLCALASSYGLDATPLPPGAPLPTIDDGVAVFVAARPRVGLGEFHRGLLTRATEAVRRAIAEPGP